MPAGLRNSQLWGGMPFLCALKGASPQACFMDDDFQVTWRCYAPTSGGGRVGSSIIYPLTTKYGIQQYKIAGVTKDSNGNPLGNCTVDLFTTMDDVKYATVISDGSGNFSVLIGPNIACYAVGYLAGSPDVAGTTVNTLMAVPI